MKKHANIPVFIPHLGCPNQCVFCNQRSISGVEKFSVSDVRRKIEDALSTIDKETDVEIAFFGGSFTGIDYRLMVQLLEIANEYVRAGMVSSIRCSTRPDYIDEKIIETLKKYNVTTVELGLQSSNEQVLFASKRGHGREAEKAAAAMITESGINFVGQMMIGLPGSTLEMEIETADFIIENGACGARIYPTLVFYETELCDMAKRGLYQPLTLGDAVYRSAAVFEKFRSAGIPVIRIGLCASENLSDESKFFAGPNHPALGELVINESYYLRLSESFAEKKTCLGDVVTVNVPRGALSKVAGQKNVNKKRLIEDFSLSDLKFIENENLSGYNYFIEIERKNRCT